MPTMKRLSIWFTANHCDVTIIRETTRSHAADSMPRVIADLRPEDRVTLYDFCSAVLACMDGDAHEGSEILARIGEK